MRTPDEEVDVRPLVDFAIRGCTWPTLQQWILHVGRNLWGELDIALGASDLTKRSKHELQALFLILFGTVLAIEYYLAEEPPVVSTLSKFDA